MEATIRKENKFGKILKKKFAFLKNKHSLFYYYLFLLLIGTLFFIASTIWNDFTTPFTGDYNSQQYSFYTNGYDDWWHFFKTGEFVLYDTNTFLGASNIGSNTFYYLFDPFFLPILLCPRQLIPQGMVILTIFKMATAGLIFYFYMRNLGASVKSSRIIGLAYAFSGWTAWYLWFNHMTEITIVFPLMLWGVERVLKTKKPWLLAFSIFLMGVTNFFYLVCCTFAAFFYALFRYFQTIKQRNAKDNFIVLGFGFLGFLVGLMMCCIVVVPAAIVSLNAPRAQNNTYLTTLKDCIKNLGDKDARKQLWSIMTSWKDLIVRGYKIENRNYFPLIEYVFPAMTCRDIPLVDYAHSYDNVGGSLYCYYPVMIFLIPALIKSIREKHYGPVIGFVLMVIALMTPFCYYMFHGFTDEPYGRWILFAETSLFAYVGLYLDKFKKDDDWTLLVGALSLQFAVFVACLLCKNLVALENGTMFSEYFSIKYAGWIAFFYIGLVYCLLRIFKNKKWLPNIFTIFISVEAICMGTFVIFGHGVSNYQTVNNGLENNNALHALVREIEKDDPTYYRCYSSQENSSARNDGMRNGYNGLGFFHSVYNFNLSDFLNWSAINDNKAPDSWSGSYVEKRTNLDTFLGVKYYFVRKGSVPYKDVNAPNFRCNVPANFVDITDKYPNDTYFVYENKSFIDFGFSFDTVYTYNSEESPENTLRTNDVIYNEELYLKGAITDYETANEMNEDANGNLIISDANGQSTDATSINLTEYKNTLLNQESKYIIKYYDTSAIKPSYKLTSNELLGLDTNSLAKVVSYPGMATEENDKYVTVINFPTSEEAYDSDGMIFYFKNHFAWNYRINVYFVDTNDHFVTYDDHNDQQLSISSYSSRKTIRGFYIAPTYNEDGTSNHDAPHIKKIIIVNKGKYVARYQLSYDSMTNYYSRLQKFYDNPIENINYSTNHFDFTTNYSSPRVVVTQLPYEDGWSVTAKDKNGDKTNLDVYKSQGGFVSFVCPEGECSYSLDYYTPYLRLGSYISIAGLTIFITTFIPYLYIHYEINQTKTLYDEECSRKTRKIKQKLFPKITY